MSDTQGGSAPEWIARKPRYVETVPDAIHSDVIRQLAQSYNPHAIMALG